MKIKKEIHGENLLKEQRNSEKEKYQGMRYLTRWERWKKHPPRNKMMKVKDGHKNGEANNCCMKGVRNLKNKARELGETSKEVDCCVYNSTIRQKDIILARDRGD